MRRAAGFTLAELMICVTIAGVLASAMGAFLLQHRALCRALSVDGEHERTARLVLEQLRRDARVSAWARASGERLTFGAGGREVSYRLAQGGLERRAGSESTHFPMLVRFEPHISGRSLTIRLELVRDLALVRRQRQLTATLMLEGP